MAGVTRKEYTPEFKREAVALVTEQGYTLVGAAQKVKATGMPNAEKTEGVSGASVSGYSAKTHGGARAAGHILSTLKPHRIGPHPAPPG